MPLVTGKVSWRMNSSNKTFAGLLNAVRDFLVNSGNYTLITSQTTLATNPYFVVKSIRNTGFAGDTIVARVGLSTFSNGSLAGKPYLYIDPWESWTGTTGTNGQSQLGWGGGNPALTQAGVTPIDLFFDTDIWISCDTTFILSMSRNYDATIELAQHSLPNGVVCIERASGDTDPGTFYGLFHYSSWNANSYSLWLPKRFDGVTGASSVINVETVVGRVWGQNSVGLYSSDELGNHVLFEFKATLPSFNRVKGKLYGVAVSTFGLDLAQGQLLPSQASPQYIVGKSAKSTILMQVASTITPIVT